MKCADCDIDLIEVTTLQDKDREYLCPNCNQVFTLAYNSPYAGTATPFFPMVQVPENKQDNTCKYCGNKFVEDARGNCASCGAHK